MSSEKIYSVDGEEFSYNEFCDVVDHLIANLEPDQFYIGKELTYWEGMTVEFKPSDFCMSAMDVIENMQCKASDAGGEWADDFGYCSIEARNTLEVFMREWANENMSVTFHGVRDEVELTFIIDKELFDTYS